MPKYSYWAAAYGHLASYVVMFIISSVLGAKYYPIPYRWGRIFGIVAAMGLIYAGSLMIDGLFFADVAIGTTSAGPLVAKLGVHTLLIIAYAAVSIYIIRKRSILR
jgi:hypothetical protein